MLGMDALFVLANLSRLMAEKMKEPIRHVLGLVNGWITTVVRRSYSHMIRGYFLPSHMQARDTDWESGLGMVLAQ